MRLVHALAQSARRMHSAGINHRDFYLCHFHLDESSLRERDVRCYLIDLHRAQIRRTTPQRWRVKDIAGLYFSAMDCGLSRRDLLRFMRHYTEGGLRPAMCRDRSLWRRVESRAIKLYRKAHGADPPVISGRSDSGG
jgi:heptose I phosphotransferase